MFVLLSANAVSMTGNAMANVAIPWFVLQTTGSAAKTGLTFAVIGLSNVLRPSSAGPWSTVWATSAPASSRTS